MGLKAIILAAGKGSRMKSDLIKVAHVVAGKPILSYVLDTVRKIGTEDIYIVAGYQADRVQDLFDEDDITFVMQHEQLGTGHAVMQVEPVISIQKDDTVIVLAGDCPLIKDDTLIRLYETHQKLQASGTILTVTMENPGSYGRILRDQHYHVLGIKEAKDCSPQEYQVKEINTGVYMFNADSLFKHLNKLNTSNAQGEYYLTDILHIQKEAGETIAAYCDPDDKQATGVNTRMDLAKIHANLNQRITEHWMKEGVTIVDPASTFIEPDVVIGQDTVIEPFTVIKGQTQIGSNCVIGSHSYLDNVSLTDNTTLSPYARLMG